MIDRFADGDSTNSRPVKRDSLYKPANWNGGDLRGVIDKIDDGYFDSLGVNVLWLSPVNLTTDKAYQEYPPPHKYYTGYHGYWPIDHQKLDPHFGEMQTLKELVVKAHNRKIKVLLDFVGHHVHIEHPFWKEHPEWFGSLNLPNGKKNLRLWDEQRLTTWFEPYLPTFNYSNLAALDTMTNNAIWWLKETGIDGFRHDAVKHIPNQFWRKLTEKIKQEIEIPERRSIYQIGETFGSDELIKSYVSPGQLNAQFNFNLYQSSLSAFIDPNGSFTALDNALRRTHDVYGTNHTMGNLMDSHDKVRYPALAEGDIKAGDNAADMAWTKPPNIDSLKTYRKVELYLTYLLTSTGVPVLYYGNEIGLTGAADPDNRRMMRFGKNITMDEQNLLNKVQYLVKLRRTHSALRQGDFRALSVAKNTFVYLRADINERLIVALNRSEEPQTVTLKLPSFYRTSNVINLKTQTKTAVSGDSVIIALPPLGAIILKPEL
jgi:cyclomaltodextrinase / maltogenic alpha-amylase / neopullulanase